MRSVGSLSRQVKLDVQVLFRTVVYCELCNPSSALLEYQPRSSAESSTTFLTCCKETTSGSCKADRRTHWIFQQIRELLRIRGSSVTSYCRHCISLRLSSSIVSYIESGGGVSCSPKVFSINYFGAAAS